MCSPKVVWYKIVKMWSQWRLTIATNDIWRHIRRGMPLFYPQKIKQVVQQLGLSRSRNQPFKKHKTERPNPLIFSSIIQKLLSWQSQDDDKSIPWTIVPIFTKIVFREMLRIRDQPIDLSIQNHHFSKNWIKLVMSRVFYPKSEI